VKKAQKGDEEAVRALLEEVHPPIRQWAMARTGDPDDAADLTQEVLILMLRKMSSYRGEARFLTWLFSVTRNQALEAVRRETRLERKMDRFRIEAEGKPHVNDDAGEALDRKRIRDRVSRFVHQLPMRQREVFQMIELQGLSSTEVSRILGLAPGSVRAALLKARRNLRRQILESHPEMAEEYVP
jgi:RNA polymerase sigma-70 factor (ECF subfamily)